MIPGIAQVTKDERVCRLKKGDDEMKKSASKQPEPCHLLTHCDGVRIRVVRVLSGVFGVNKQKYPWS